MSTLSERLQEALERYGEHTEACEHVINVPCICGLTQALELTQAWEGVCSKTAPPGPQEADPTSRAVPWRIQWDQRPETRE